MTVTKVESSFRDPSGFVFHHEGLLYRQVNVSYREHYDALIRSGLYDRLTREGLLVSHEEVSLGEATGNGVYRILRPQKIPFISYPYEWCFGELRDAALATLSIQRAALDHGMSLKDASAFNMQFLAGRPICIDTLSFEAYPEGRPWIAYRQFCQHFLAPLALMRYRDARLGQLFKSLIDGVPLDLAETLLPFSSKLNLPVLIHIHLHAKSQRRHAGKAIDKSRLAGRFGRRSFLGLLDSLESAIRKLRWNPATTAWSDYYTETHDYASRSLEHKAEVVRRFLDTARPGSVWDLGANTGRFSRIASGRGIPTVAFDADPSCTELNYRTVVENRETHLLPLIVDLTNPSPAIGWDHRERLSLAERGPADALLALALVHHLAIANNVPLARIAAALERLGRWLIIEFVPKQDPQVKRLLATREDIFTDYTRDGFEAAFRGRFAIEAAADIEGSARVLYLMKAKQAE